MFKFLDSALVDSSALVDHVTSGCGLARVNVTDYNNVDVGTIRFSRATHFNLAYKFQKFENIYLFNCVYVAARRGFYNVTLPWSRPRQPSERTLTS